MKNEKVTGRCIVDMINCTKKQRESYKNYMYFQVWHNKINTGNFVITGVSNVLSDRSNVENYNNCMEIINHCALAGILCAGIMVHYSTGCYFHTND